MLRALLTRQEAQTVIRRPRARPRMLEAFIRFLIDNGLLKREAPADDDQWVDELRQISCCVILAGRLGLRHGYTFQGGFLGPESDDLDDEYDDGVAARARAGLGGDAPALPASFDRDRFLRLTAGRDAEWVATAGCMIIYSHARPNVEELAEWIGGLKVGRSPARCRAIVRDLTSPEIGIVLDCDKFMEDDPWQPAVASATHCVGAGGADADAGGRPIPVAAG